MSLRVAIQNSKLNGTNKNWMVKYIRQELRINGVCCKTYFNVEAPKINREYGIIKKSSLELIELVGIKFDGEEIILYHRDRLN